MHLPPHRRRLANCSDRSTSIGRPVRTCRRTTSSNAVSSSPRCLRSPTTPSGRSARHRCSAPWLSTKARRCEVRWDRPWRASPRPGTGRIALTQHVRRGRLAGCIRTWSGPGKEQPSRSGRMRTHGDGTGVGGAVVRDDDYARHADRSIKCGTSGNRVGCADELGEAVVSIEALAGTPLQRAVGACEGDRRDGDPPV